MAGDSGVATYNEDTIAQPIGDTRLRRFVVLLALKTTAKFFGSEPSCSRITRNTVVKTGPFVDLAEAQTMRFVAERTSLPVPKVRCAFIHKQRAYIVMERIRGQEVPTAWKSLSAESKEKVFGQLKDMIQELRSLSPNSSSIANCNGGSLRDSRIPRDGSRFGPFSNAQSFHLWLRDNFDEKDMHFTMDSQTRQDIHEMIAKQDGPWPSPVFTHGDLTPFNILLHGDSVVGIIDWEFSGWYPHYWEYSSAWLGNRLATEWQGLLHKFLEPYPEELKMEEVRSRWWGDF